MRYQRIGVLLLLFMFALANEVVAEGSKDLVASKGYRLFYNAQQRQQLKVYAGPGEIIQVGASHVGVSGGFIRVIRPNGSVHTIFNNTGSTAGKAIIYNRTQEMDGPTGGGTINGPGYEPGVIEVLPNEGGVWTIMLEYPLYTTSAFANVLNTEDWNRTDHQPTNQRVVLAWDVTVSKLLPVHDGGEPVTGRLFTQEFVSLINDNGSYTDLKMYVLSHEGVKYMLELEDIDPWGWFISSNNRGIVTSKQQPVSQSLLNTEFIRSWQPEQWQEGPLYHYEPQTRDIPNIANNKLFFNEPDHNLPVEAPVWDVYRSFGYSTWLNPQLPDYSKPINNVDFAAVKGQDSIYSLCGNYVMGVGLGGYITFEALGYGNIEMQLDIDQNGLYTDPMDVTISKFVYGGKDSIFWDGHDGLGIAVPAQDDFPLNIKFQGTIYSGEMHFMLFDVESMQGGILITRLNGVNPGDVPYYFDHSEFGGEVSGGGSPGEPMPITGKHGFATNLGDEKLMDYWTYYAITELVFTKTIFIDIVDGCYDPELDSDRDGIIDVYDLDDDNDGIPDKMEYCGGKGFGCLPGGFDPSGDEDKDKIPNCMDADDPALNNPCEDLDGNGICDRVAAVYDTDGDGVPNYLDLDSDNDGISDLQEAQHDALDLTGNGRIDAPLPDFGDNGFYNPLSNKPNGLDAVANYILPDGDKDLVHDNVDLDSDNDGIHDVAENGFGQYDSNNDGMMDDGTGHPHVDKFGLPVQVSPTVTGLPLPTPIDFDNDGIFNQNDHDSDNDGLFDVTETPNSDPDEDGIIGVGKPQADSYGRPVMDSAGDLMNCTSFPANTDNVQGADFQDLDSDGDGIWDSYEADVFDPDFDGTAGFGTPIVNSKGVPVIDENGDPIVPVPYPPDFDGDGIPDYRDWDSDNDGISDGYECYDFENGHTHLPCLDTDGDGLHDRHDLDSDNDGLSDTQECAFGDNPDCPDSSGNGIDDFRDPNLFFNEDVDDDGIPNSVDIDNDNDGIPDHREFCPQPGFACLPGGLHPDGDEDQDQIPNFMDADDPAVNNPCEDVNGDGICDRVNLIYDHDGDGIANHNDLDSDNDGIVDMYEAGHDLPDVDGNGMIDGPPAVFGLNGLFNPIATDPNSLSADIIYSVRESDYDGIRDFLDLDTDNDGLHDVAENGTPQYDSNDDGRMDNGSGLPDVGWMGIPRLVNPVYTGIPMNKPRDKDGDNIPNYRDIDSDNDGIHDAAEQKMSDADNDGIPGLSPVIVDANGRLLLDEKGTVIFSTTAEVDTDQDGIPDYFDLDSDADQIPDVLEAQMSDPDQDGMPGTSPLLVNNRGGLMTDALGNVINSISNPRDLDLDGKPDFQDIDRDNDGIRDGYECIFPYNCVDTDGDGTPDVDDLNSDGDCELDIDECPGGDPCPDSSGNGVPDFRQFECCPPFEPVLSAMGDTVNACSGKPIVLTGQNMNPFPANITYTWNGPGFTYTNTVSNQAPFNAPIIPGLSSGGTYTLSAISTQGCLGASVAIELLVKQTPAQPSLQVDPTEICIGDEVILSSQIYVGPNLLYSWHYTAPSGQSILLGETQTPIFSIPGATSSNDGAYTVIVSVDGCQSSASSTKVINVLPPANLSAGDDQFTMQLEEVVLEESVLGNDQFNTGSIMVSLIEGPESGTLLLFANGEFRYTAEAGFKGFATFTYQICGELCDSDCDTATVNILVRTDNIPEDCNVHNIISPNNDGDNDYLYIPCIDLYPKHELRVYNRWGDEVYATEEYKQNWDGQWNGHPLPPGTYFYFLRVYGNNPQDLQGFVTIIH